MGYKSLNPESYNNISQISSKKEEVVRLFIALGKQSGINKKQLIDYIVKNTGISSKVISDITVLDKFSFITVPYREAEIILSVFKKRGRRSIVSKARARN
jgi:ATP-dependent RNA helicase DeaD